MARFVSGSEDATPPGTDALAVVRLRLEAGLEAGLEEELECLADEIFDMLDRDAHVTWAAIEQSRLNKAVGELQRRAAQGSEGLRRVTARLRGKLVEVSDRAKGGGSCMELKAGYREEVRPGALAPPRAKTELVDLSPGSAWHPVPSARSHWRLEQGGQQPQRVEVASDAINPADSSSTRPRVRGRVSIIVPTLAERYKFHGQIWLCFHAQTYQDKELIVVGSGEPASPFFTTLTPEQSNNVRYVHVEEPLSVGAKRNFAIREYSTGEIIANFDDDELYFPAYLSTMVKTLKLGKAAMAHLSAWHVLDSETECCATFNSATPRPSKSEAVELSLHCGFSMVYTYAAWNCVPWPPWTCGEDALYLRAFEAVGLPIVSRADDGRAITVLHVQHGRNMRRSVCHAMRTDTAAMAAMMSRFETACRRLMKINLQEYEDGGETLLYSYTLSLNAEPPAPSGMYVLATEGEGTQGDEAFATWQNSPLGLHPNRESILQRQRAAEDS